MSRIQFVWAEGAEEAGDGMGEGGDELVLEMTRRRPRSFAPLGARQSRVIAGGAGGR